MRVLGRPAGVMEIEEEFHRTRRMFVKNGKTLLVARLGDPRSHEEWFKSYKDSEGWMRSYVRGFFDINGVYLYIQTDGSKWDVTEQVVQEAPKIVWGLHMLKLKMSHLYLDLLDGLPVYGGMVPGALGTRWFPKCNLGLRTGELIDFPGSSAQKAL